MKDKDGAKKKRIKENKEKAEKWWKAECEKMTLEQIEGVTTHLALTMDTSNFFINSKRIEALNMVANQKIQRMKIEAMERENAAQTTAEPIRVEFVSANTPESKERVDRLTKEVEESLAIHNPNA